MSTDKWKAENQDKMQKYRREWYARNSKSSIVTVKNTVWTLCAGSGITSVPALVLSAAKAVLPASRFTIATLLKS